MTFDPLSAIERREFLKLAGAITVSSLAHTSLAEPGRRISLMVDAADPIACGKPVHWAVGQLRKALAAKGALCEIVHSEDQAKGAGLCVLIAGAGSKMAGGFPHANTKPASPESLRLTPGRWADAVTILVSAIGERGFIYGLLELAERVEFSSDPMSALHLTATIEEKPANRVRSVGRYFCSETEDKAWYYDKNFWRGYLDALVASRFNRFCLGFGLEYDFPRGVTSDYFHFPYPYLVDVPGYNVQAIQLASPDGDVLATPVPVSAEERRKNFEMLRFIAAETGARGLHFQLGLWTHAYQWTDSPNAYHRIDGLTPETHAAYCRDALALLLKACPEIQGLTLRVHGESGIPEGSYPFWKTLFGAIQNCGRSIEIDMHSKGVNQTMIDMAVDTGMPVKLGAKYSAEHQSLGYNQTDIRALEIPRPGHLEPGPFSLSGGSRSFTRYGYADFLEQGSHYQLLFRLWPGTQRHLLSADPAMAAAYGRTAHFCGAAGLELMEPLTFKGREGSGLAGGRCAYADESLNPKADWKKFEYYYRVWGRCLYDPEADPETWRRFLRRDFGAGALTVETAVANASRILPLLTSAHLPSASNHSFWAELYENMPMVQGTERLPYSDTPAPKTFGAVSPLDPQIFSTIAEYARELLAGHPNPKYSPVEVAQWLEDLAAAAGLALDSAHTTAKSHRSPEFRRMEEDVLIQNGLGGFFAAKLRSGVLFEIYQQTGSAEAGRLALVEYRKARESWSKMASRASGVYRANITYGNVPGRRGHWDDRLSAIDRDIEAVENALKTPPVLTGTAQDAERAIQTLKGKPHRVASRSVHTQPASFKAGQPLALSLAVPVQNAANQVHLCYRHVNQGERWLRIEMQRDHNGYSGAIPGSYTDSAFPLQYYFELQAGSGAAWFHPAFNATFSNQPYYAVFKRST